jgi:molybdopterin converting factor subunit 1
MRIRVLFFATLRDRTGLREDALDLPEGATVADLRDSVAEKHPGAAPALPTALASVNQEFAFPEEELHEGDEVALFPPVSGGSGGGGTIIRLTRKPFDMNAVLEQLVSPTAGAVCMFTGVVRRQTERGERRETEYLEYEAYAEMAEAKLEQIGQEIREQWPAVEGIALIQRLGHIDPGAPSVLVACTAPHRDSGVFEAARYGIDRLKQIVPIWKKEVGSIGQVWVEGDYKPTEGDKR